MRTLSHIVIWMGLWLLPSLLQGAATVSTAYYDLAVLNLVRDKGNVQLILLLKPNAEKALVRPERGTDDLVAKLELRVEARSPQNQAVLYEWRFRDQVRQAASQAGNQLLRVYPLRIDARKYDIHVEIKDLNAGRTYFEAMPFESRDSEAAWAVSDISLDFLKSFGPVSISQPLYGLHVETKPDTLRYQVELNAPFPEPLTVRAVLYVKQEAAQTLAGDAARWQVSHYITYEQRTDILQPQVGRNVVEGTFALSDASDGEYRLELAVFRDSLLLASTHRSFVLDWPQLSEIFGNLERAIAWMGWIASSGERARLLSFKESDQRIREFMAWWERWAGPGDGGARQAMKRYFSRIFYANTHFEEDQEGWKTDRGRVHVLYGSPDERETIPFPGTPVEVWVYKEWSLIRAFRKSDSGYQQLKI